MENAPLKLDEDWTLEEINQVLGALNRAKAIADKYSWVNPKNIYFVTSTNYLKSTINEAQKWAYIIKVNKFHSKED